MYLYVVGQGPKWKRWERKGPGRRGTREPDHGGPRGHCKDFGNDVLGSYALFLCEITLVTGDYYVHLLSIHIHLFNNQLWTSAGG